MLVRIDCVSHAILAHRNLDPVETLSAYRRETEDGTLYRTDDFSLVDHDAYAPPVVDGPRGMPRTLDAYCRVAEDVTLYGPMASDGGIADPLVMVHDVNLSETTARAAAGLRLRDVMEVDGHPTLAALGDVGVTRIINGDRREDGGHAYVHIHLDPLWQEIEAEIVEEGV